jgi:hypothetical protein
MSFKAGSKILLYVYADEGKRVLRVCEVLLLKCNMVE